MRIGSEALEVEVRDSSLLFGAGRLLEIWKKRLTCSLGANMGAGQT